MPPDRNDAATILILGYGTGVSRAVARKFGAAGYCIAMVARQKAKLERALEELHGEGIQCAHAFVADLSDLEALRPVIEEHVPAKLGAIKVIHHNANYWPSGDFLTEVSSEALQSAHGVCVTSLIVAVQSALPQLRSWPRGTASVLVTNGGAGLLSAADRYARTIPGGALCNAEKMEAARLLAPGLLDESIHLGEVVIAAIVAPDCTPQTVCSEHVASVFWSLHTMRDAHSLTLHPASEASAAPGPSAEPTTTFDCRRLPPSPPYPNVVVTLPEATGTADLDAATARPTAPVMLSTMALLVALVIGVMRRRSRAAGKSCGRGREVLVQLR